MKVYRLKVKGKMMTPKQAAKLIKEGKLTLVEAFDAVLKELKGEKHI